MDDIKQSVKAILQKQEDVEKAVKSIKTTSNIQEQDKDPRRSDQISQDVDASNALDKLKNEVFKYPFMKYFEYCAIQQNFTRQSTAKCVFNYSIARPVFYRFCRQADFILHCLYVVSLIVFVILIVFRVFGFI